MNHDSDNLGAARTHLNSKRLVLEPLHIEGRMITEAQLANFIEACTKGNSHGEHGVPERIHLDRLVNVLNKFFSSEPRKVRMASEPTY